MRIVVFQALIFSLFLLDWHWDTSKCEAQISAPQNVMQQQRYGQPVSREALANPYGGSRYPLVQPPHPTQTYPNGGLENYPRVQANPYGYHPGDPRIAANPNYPHSPQMGYRSAGGHNPFFDSRALPAANRQENSHSILTPPNLPIPSQGASINQMAEPQGGIRGGVQGGVQTHLDTAPYPYGNLSPYGNLNPYGSQIARRQDVSPLPMPQTPLTQQLPQNVNPGNLPPEPMASPMGPQVENGAAPVGQMGNNGYGYDEQNQWGRHGEGQRRFPFGNWFGHRRGCVDDSCFDTGCCRCGWFGSIGALVMFRDLEDDIVFVQPIGDPVNNLLVSTDAAPGTFAGTEFIVGHYFCCCYGIQGVYWGLFEQSDASEIGTSNSNVVTTNTQTTFSTFNYFDIVTRTNVTTTVDTFFTGTPGFRISRNNEIHNVELNFLRFSCCEDDCCEPCGDCCDPCGNGYGGRQAGYGYGQRRGYRGVYGRGCNDCCDPCGSCLSCRPLRFNILGGIRFFTFNEDFLFQAETAGDIPVNAPADLNYLLAVDNSLVGFQVGGDLEARFYRRWRLLSGTRFGIYGNTINHQQQIFGPAGFAVSNVGAFAGQPYNINSSKTDVAFMGQFDLSLNYDFGRRWGVGFGYRVLAIDGIALAPTQIPRNFADYQDAADINSNNSLILHGAFLRAHYNF